MGTEGWRVGFVGTANRLSHPKIPNYVIQNIPRDPGTTYSFNAGVGMGRAVRATAIAADLIYEPIFAETWADAATDSPIAGGGVVRAGDKTVENTFRFNNVRMRIGAGHEFPAEKGTATFGLQAGLALHAINYHLDQKNNLTRSSRTQHEDWIEWTPSFGIRVKARDVDIMYNFQRTAGPGRESDVINVPDILIGRGIIAAPSGTLFMNSGSLTVHKLTLAVPIR